MVEIRGQEKSLGSLPAIGRSQAYGSGEQILFWGGAKAPGLLPAIERSRAYGWGAISTSRGPRTGPRLRYVLRIAGAGSPEKTRNPWNKAPSNQDPEEWKPWILRGRSLDPSGNNPLFPGAKSQIYLGIFEGVDPSIAAVEAGLGRDSEACRRDPRGLLKTAKNGFAVPEDTLAFSQIRLRGLGSFLEALES
jgi:hypothetical protein